MPAALVTFAAAAGLTIGMTSPQVAHRLHAPIVVVGSGSSAWSYVPICRGATHGDAYFFGLDANTLPAQRKPLDGLMGVGFTSGAHTDRGVGIGSTRAAVRKAYGSELQADGRDLYVRHGNVVILFEFLGRSRVAALFYGRQNLVGADRMTPLLDSKVYCP